MSMRRQSRRRRRLRTRVGEVPREGCTSIHRVASLAARCCLTRRRSASGEGVSQREPACLHGDLPLAWQRQQSAYAGAESDVDVGLRVVEEVGGEHRQTQIGECLRHCSSFQPALCAAFHVVSVTLPESAAASLTSRVSVSILLSPTTFPVRSAATSVSAQPVVWGSRLSTNERRPPQAELS
jgi:hypothetical protein